MKKSIILVLFMVCAFVMNAQNYFDFVRGVMSITMLTPLRQN